MPERQTIASPLSLVTSEPRHTEPLDAPPPPATEPAPYEVRVRRSVGGTVTLVGHNGRGEPMSEWRMPREKLSARIVERFGRWCRDNDDGPSVHIVSG